MTEQRKAKGKIPASFGPEKTPPDAIKERAPLSATPQSARKARSTGIVTGDAKTKARKERKHFVSSLTVEQRQQATQLLQDPKPLNDAEIARQVGCSYKAIKSLKERLITTGDVAARVITVYERRFVRELPPKERVKLYAAIARGEIDAKRAFSSLKSLQRVEELEGIVTKKEQKEHEPLIAPQAPGPVFVIQGASVSVHTPLPMVVEPKKLIEVTETIDVSAVDSTTHERTN